MTISQVCHTAESLPWRMGSRFRPKGASATVHQPSGVRDFLLSVVVMGASHAKLPGRRRSSRSIFVAPAGAHRFGWSDIDLRETQ